MDDGVETDEQLMLRLAQGSESALHALMARHMQRALRFAESIVRNTAEADDIAQEAFLRVWRNASGFDPDRARFSTWFNRIVVNLAIDYARKPRNDPARNEPIEEHLEIPADGESALARLLVKEQQQAMAKALACLPERQRAAIALFHFEDLSARECAETMGLNGKAFESLLHRARCALKKILADENSPGGAV
jgi:RNA polymerase sigma-70 factor, ECF subfamily